MKWMFQMCLTVAALASLAGCGASSATVSPLPTPSQAQPTARAQDPAQLLRDVLLEPEAYLGKEITVEGLLEVEGKMPRLRFFLHGEEGQRLEVSSWAPFEVVRPPSGGGSVKTMVDYVGRRLCLTGVLERKEGGIILTVSVVEER